MRTFITKFALVTFICLTVSCSGNPSDSDDNNDLEVGTIALTVTGDLNIEKTGNAKFRS